MLVHQQLAATLDHCYARIREIQADARRRGARAIDEPPAWPAIVLRTPKGWTGPAVVDGQPMAGTFRAHQVPLVAAKTDPAQLHLLEEWLQSYEPGTLFTDAGALVPSWRPSHRRARGAWAPTRTRTAGRC